MMLADAILEGAMNAMGASRITIDLSLNTDLGGGAILWLRTPVTPIGPPGMVYAPEFIFWNAQSWQRYVGRVIK